MFKEKLRGNKTVTVIYGKTLLTLGGRRISKLVMINVGGPINIAPYIHVLVRVVMYRNHHTIHQGEECHMNS